MVEKSVHGGRRPGSGRPSTGRKKKNIYVTDEEYAMIAAYLEKLRETPVKIIIQKSPAD